MAELIIIIMGNEMPTKRTIKWGIVDEVLGDCLAVDDEMTCSKMFKCT